MSKFTERLWRDLEREHGADLAQIARPATRPRVRTRARVLACTTVGLAGIGTALALILSAAGSSPAFAVSRNNDGTITLQIKAVRGILGANAKLAALGVRARAVQVTSSCRPPAGAPPPLRHALARAQGRLAHASWVPAGVITEARIDPRKIPVGHTLVLPALRVGRQVRLAPSHAVLGQAPGCFPFPPGAALVRRGQLRGVICHVDALAKATSVPLGVGANSGKGATSGSPPKIVERPVECRPIGTARSGSSGKSGNGGNGGKR